MLHHCDGTFFSLLFPLSGSKHSANNNVNTSSSYNNDTEIIFGSSTVVDCTLSLGTPSTRHAQTTPTKPPHGTSRQLSGSRASSVSRDACVSAKSNGYTKQLNRSSGSACKDADGSARLPRRCANCDTTSTPLWRNGPRGPKSLCNACGIRYKKEERRAAAATSVSPMLDCTSGYVPGYSYQSSHQQQSWGCYGSSVGKSTDFTAYGDETSNSRDLAYIPWRLNVVQPQPFPFVDRTGLYQYN